VLYLKQHHYVPDRNDAAIINKVAHSQFDVAQEILTKPGALIFPESLTENLNPALYQKLKAMNGSMVGAAETIFPNGMPDNFEELSAVQTEFIAELGASKTLFFLGEVDHVQRSMDPKVSQQIDAEIQQLQKQYGPDLEVMVEYDPKLRYLIFEARENELYKEVQETTKKPENAGKPVVVIFGGAHDLGRGLSAENGFNLRVKDLSGAADHSTPEADGLAGHGQLDRPKKK